MAQELIMKITSFRKIFLSLSAVVFVSSAVFSQEAEESKNQKKNADIWKFYEQTAAAYYFKSDYVSGGDHFAPITGLFNSFEFKTTFNAECKIPAPLGKHFLLKDSNVRIKTAFELCPVTVRPLVSVSFTPLPFFVFSTGASIGTGWSALGFKGLSIFDEDTFYSNKIRNLVSDLFSNPIAFLPRYKKEYKDFIEYENLTPFGNYYYDFWFSGLFQFDTGAIFPGDWTHAVMQASYTVSYVGVTGVDDGKIWLWQLVGNNCNGWRYTANFVLGYQMPLPLSMIAVNTDVYALFNSDDYGIYSSSYNGDFTNVTISPMLKFDFSKKDSLFVLFEFKKRRSFEEEHSESKEEIFLTYSGAEWFFNRIAFSWTHIF